jgi:hypothetical protein
MRAPAPNSAPAPALLIGAACLLAAAEYGSAFLIGRFVEWGRAEPLLFLAFRPWIMLAAALLARRWPVRARYGLYGLTLLLATLAESLTLAQLGADAPWSDALRGLAAGALVATVFDLLIQGGRWFGRLGLAGAAVAGLAVLTVPGALAPYERLVLGPAPPESAAAKPDLMLMTALPIIWGEGGAFDPNARPAESYRYLQREFAVRPLDTLDPAQLAGGRLLLLAQPRALAPEELVALDAWVRRGGRVLILADPQLDWPSALPLGDIRRPPPLSFLGPLFTHWGLRLDPGLSHDTGGARLTTDQLPEPGWRLAVTRPGHLQAPNCPAILLRIIVRCAIGSGQAILVADADLMRDDLWAPFGPGRHQRTADNPLIVAEWLDQLAGTKRERLDGGVQWLDPDVSLASAIAFGLLPLAFAALLGFVLSRVSRR